MALALPTSAQSPSPHPDVVVGEQHTARGELIHLTNGTLRILLCETGIARITYVNSSTIPDLSNPALPDALCTPTAFSVHDSAAALEIATARLAGCSRYRTRSNLSPGLPSQGSRLVRFLDRGSDSPRPNDQSRRPLSVLPLYVRAGTILPLGPEEEYTDKHPSAPTELRIYPGTDGDATLYSDDGLTYAYEKGQYARTPLHWNDASRTLTVAERQGHFAGDSASHEVHVLLVTPGYGTGEAVVQGGNHLAYTGRTKQMQFQK